VRQVSCFRLALVAVTGLMHLIVGVAVSEDAVFLSRQTDVAPVTSAIAIEVLHPNASVTGVVGVQDVAYLILRKNIVAVYRGIQECFCWIGRNSWRNWETPIWPLNQTWGKRFTPVSHQGEPLFYRLLSIGSAIDFPCSSEVNCWSFSIVHPIKIDEHLVAFDDMDVFWRDIFEVPNIRSLLNPKLLTVVVNTFARKGSLPIGDSGIDDDSKERKPFEPHFFVFTSPVFLAFGLMCGIVFFALGAVSLLYFWRTMNLDGTAYKNLVFGFSLTASAGIIWFGQWIIFSVFGLVP
jgi:hypothetical protein